MANVVDGFFMRVLCLMTLFSFSHSSVVIDGGVGSTSVSLLRYDGDLASLVANLEAKVNKLATWSEDHPFVRELVKRIEKLELVTAQQAEKISVLELKPAQQLETEIQNLKNAITEQGKELMAQYSEKLNSSEKVVLETVESKIDTLKQVEIKPLQQLFQDTMADHEKERFQETQGLNSTIAEQGMELALAIEKLEKLEKDVATKTLEIDNALVVNLSDYKGGRLTVKTTHGRILAFQPVNNDSLEDALKFIKIFNAKDGTRLTLHGNKTLNPNLLHSDAAYKTFYANSNRAVIEFNAEIPHEISIKISKAVGCPNNLGPGTQCARVFKAESCYCAVLTTRTWQEQNAFCQSNGFSLLTLESAEEEKAVTKIWGSIAFWMSLNDLKKERTWVWDASGATLGSFDYVNWAKGEPNDVKDDEDCVEWKPAGSGWNDNSCNVQIGAICERQPTSANKVPSSCVDLRNAGQSASGLYQVQSVRSHQTISTVFCDMSKDVGDEGLERLLGYTDIKPTDFVRYSSTVPSSCADLRKAGQSTSGLYQVQTNDNELSTVFCDMSEAIESKDFETVIDINDIKPALVHFSVARTSNVDLNDTVITYDHEWVNLGDAMNIESGVFTTPTAGIYSFTLDAVGLGNDSGWVHIRRNGNGVAGSWIAQGETDHSAASVHLTISLAADDQVDTYSPSVKLYSSNATYSINFSGSLLVKLD